MSMDVPAYDFEEGDDAAVRRLQQHAVRLSEHFDTVQIICTKLEAGTPSTRIIALGTGNFYARVGSTRAWVTHEERGF